MAEIKTKPGDGNVAEFLDSVENPRRRADATELCKLMQKVTGEKPVLWGPAIVGFGSQHLKYESGRELDTPRISFSPRKGSLTLYFNEGFDGYSQQLEKLGNATTAKACLYIKNLDDVDRAVLAEMIKQSYEANTGRL